MVTRSIRAVFFAFAVLMMSSAAFSQVRISVGFGPPALPVYEQPLCPGDGYIWTPGYWAWSNDDGDYYWVPGTWVAAPEVGYLWTPPYWGWNDGAFIFNDGYWGPHVGFYGGISYGFGYFGNGFEGGRWDGGHFFYNRSVTNVNVTVIHNVYNTTVINRTENRVSFNGGEGGVVARPTAEQETAMHERHIPPPAAQTQHIQAARENRELRASVNQGKPPVAATAKPGEFKAGAVAAREAGAPYHPPANRPEANRAAAAPRDESRPENNGHPAPAPAVHPKDIPPAERPAAPNTGNAKTDQKYQQQQQKLQKQQDQERQKLQQQQDKDHQRLDQQKANEASKQQTEQKHQQQTQQLQQRHTQQQEQLQHKQAPPPSHPEAKPPKG